MARRLAHRDGGRGEAYDDLAQVAALALIKAVDGYDPQRGSVFVSYAIPTIIGSLKRHFRDTAWGLRVPRAMQKLVLLVRATSGELAHWLGRPPTAAELAGHAYRPGSLNEELSIVDSAGRTNLVRATGTIDPNVAAIDNALMVRTLVAARPERERRIVIMRFHGEMTQTRIAAAVGVSQMHVSRLLRLILTQLRVAMAKA
jgi:RNA polymerase sigma-B factor